MFTKRSLALSGKYIVSSNEIEKFNNKGHILLKGVACKNEINLYKPYLNKLMENVKQQNKPLDERKNTYNRAFLQSMNLWKNDRNLKEFILAKRFAGIAAALLETDNVRLYYDSALFKEPGGDATPIHVDPFLIDSQKVITMWMPLVDLNEGLKSLFFLSGSHKLSDGNTSPIRIINKAVRQKLPMDIYEGMEAGDATFHIGSIVHGAPGNETRKTREILTITYFADGEMLKDPRGNKILESHMVSFFPGLYPGDPAMSKNNPSLL
ncbi:phytanoyl-CoA dioxygenase family protein [Bacillus sp. 166amftsu]|uniref:phytanoyl-CoA dioxygenase family protein n=1 Tax=Bacillus sp. 166amftsu TaxID=1761753 RepID=UPI000899185A|nr:phytanoyl-CoA dioxygenase family protein [Bacillus sp. 166amftsu]SDZ40479.1 Phytanoyl-CoA dioxygenase (PhyH) [Bacillus sp. 166amftsu]